MDELDRMSWDYDVNLLSLEDIAKKYNKSDSWLKERNRRIRKGEFINPQSEHIVLDYRSGLYKNYDDIAMAYGISKTRVGQIIAKFDERIERTSQSEDLSLF